MWTIAAVFLAYPYLTGQVPLFTDTSKVTSTATLKSDVVIVGEIMQTLEASYTATPVPSPTPVFTFTPVPSPTLALTPVSEGFKFTFAYSYYYPDLLGVNCHDDNVYRDEQGIERCKNVSASGQGWRDYVGKGVAIPITYSAVFDATIGGVWCEVFHNPCIPFGTVIRVSAPAALAGDWYVMDTCGACDDRKNSGLVYLDFLTTNQMAPWSSAVEVTILEVK